MILNAHSEQGNKVLQVTENGLLLNFVDIA